MALRWTWVHVTIVLLAVNFYRDTDSQVARVEMAAQAAIDIDTPDEYNRLVAEMLHFGNENSKIFESPIAMTTSSALASFRYLITDMDGVLWRSKTPLPGLAEFFKFLREREIRFVCATNNASTLAGKLAERLQAWGADVTPNEIVTSSTATADYLETILPPGSRLYVIGMEGLRVPLKEKGFELADDNVSAVVVGIDWDLTYQQLKRAALNIRAGAKFIGTNGDRTFPSSEGIIPGAGAILAAIETGTGVNPIVMGKPEPYLYQAALKRMQAVPEQTLVLGDRLETDILGAVRLGLKSALVLSGVTAREQLASSDHQPNWVFEDISDLKQQWEASFRS